MDAFGRMLVDAIPKKKIKIIFHRGGQQNSKNILESIFDIFVFRHLERTWQLSPRDETTDNENANLDAPR